MGFSTKIKVGYYFDIPPRVVTVTRELKKCVGGCNKIHPEWGKDKFCSDCGKSIVIVSEEVTETIENFIGFCEDHPTLMEFEDVVMTPQFRPNNSFHWIDLETIDNPAEMSVDAWLITDLSQRPLLPKAKKEIDKIIKAFEAIYGEGSISLKYGIYCFTY